MTTLFSEKKKDCQACSLRANALNVVVGEGPTNAPVLILVDQPDEKSDASGRLFHHQSMGRDYLRWLLGRLSLAVDHCRIIASVCCYPRSEDRTPIAPPVESLQRCSHWVKKEIQR